MNFKIKQKIKERLYHRFHRLPTHDEEVNAENDSGIIVPILLEEIKDLEKRIIKLEKK